jgi:protein SCO1/2
MIDAAPPPSGASFRPLVLLAAASICLVAIAVFGCRFTSEHDGSYAATNTADCLPAITLTDQSGHQVSLASLKGKPVLIDFIYTSCSGPCPRLTAKMAQIAGRLGPELGARIAIVSITLDPEHDHSAQLLRYAKAQGADQPGWLFLTGAPEEIERVMAGFGLKREREADGSVSHMVAAYLVGPDGHQVRQYNAVAVKPATVAGDIDRLLGAG